MVIDSSVWTSAIMMSSPSARARWRSSAIEIAIESSQVPLALKPLASALMASIAFSSLDHCDFVRFNVTSAEEVLRPGTRGNHF